MVSKKLDHELAAAQQVVDPPPSPPPGMEEALLEASYRKAWLEASYCSACEMWLNGQVQLKDHQVVKKHRKRLRRLGLLRRAGA